MIKVSKINRQIRRTKNKEITVIYLIDKILTKIIMIRTRLKMPMKLELGSKKYLIKGLKCNLERFRPPRFLFLHLI